MKFYIVTNCEFNQHNYPDLINQITENPPGYAIVQVLEPYRKWTCWNCSNEWVSEVEMSKVGTANISGEKTVYCPNCNKAGSVGSEWIDSNGEPIFTNMKFIKFK